MFFALKIICLCCLMAVIAQDFRERKVYLFLLIGLAIVMNLFYYLKSDTLVYLSNISINLTVLLVLMGILFLYSKLKLKQALNTALGLGDILFFVVIAISFPVATFLVLFFYSLLFSLVLFLFLKPKLLKKSVPLAGLQALFFLLVFSFNWMFHFTDLYAF